MHTYIIVYTHTPTYMPITCVYVCVYIYIYIQNTTNQQHKHTNVT